MAHGDVHGAVVEALGVLSELYSEMHRDDEALKMVEEHLRISRILGGDFWIGTAVALSRSGGIFSSLHNYEEALARYTEAHKIVLQIEGPDSQHTAVDLANIGLAYSNLGKADKALKTYKEALRIYRLDSGRYTDNQQCTINIANTLLNIGGEYRKLERPSEAEKNLTEALELFRRIYGNKHPAVARDLKLIAEVVLDQGKLDEALEIMKKCVKISNRFLKDGPDVAEENMSMGLIYMQQGKHEEALAIKSVGAQILCQESDRRRRSLLQFLGRREHAGHR